MRRPIETRPAMSPAALRTAIICAGLVLCVVLAVAFGLGWL